MLRRLSLFVGLAMVACRAPVSVAGHNWISEPCTPSEDHEICSVSADDLALRLSCDPTTAVWSVAATCKADERCVSGSRSPHPEILLTFCAPTPADDAGTATGDAPAAQHADTAKAPTDQSSASDLAHPDVANGDTGGVQAKDTEVVANPPAHAACLMQFCGPQMDACAGQKDCMNALALAIACYDKCGGSGSCVSACAPAAQGNATALQILQTCAGLCAGGTCGNKSCDAGETYVNCPGDCVSKGVGTCAGHCGGASTDCHCDPPCIKAGDCCADYATQCPP